MQGFRNVRFLLAVDAAFCLVGAIVLVVLAGDLASAMKLPEALLRGAGIVLLPWAAFVGWCATRNPPSRRAVLAVVVLNGVWVADSLLLLGSGWVMPNGVGTAFILAQAAAGGGIALLQALALPPAGGLQRA
jgi:hypothetical protein